MAISGLSFYGKSKTSRYITSEIIEKSAIVNSSVDIVMNENPNLSVIIDPDVFNASIISANDSKGESKSEKVKIIKIGRKIKKNCDLKTVKGKITKAKMNKKDKKDCVNAVYKTNKPIEYCPLCMVKLIPTQFTINIISLVMKTICVCGLAIEIKIARF